MQSSSSSRLHKERLQCRLRVGNGTGLHLPWKRSLMPEDGWGKSPRLAPGDLKLEGSLDREIAPFPYMNEEAVSRQSRVVPEIGVAQHRGQHTCRGVAGVRDDEGLHQCFLLLGVTCPVLVVLIQEVLGLVDDAPGAPCARGRARLCFDGLRIAIP